MVTSDIGAELDARINERLNDELLILAEASTGESVEHAVRPLSEAERASGVRFGDIQAVQYAYLEAVTPVILVLMGAAADAVTAEAARAAMSATMLRVLDEWRTMPPRALQEAMEVAITRVDEALTVAYRESATLVIKEAASQGVRVAAATETAPVTRQSVQTMATNIADNTLGKVLDTARTVYAAPAATIEVPTPAAVETALTEISIKGPVDVARQASNAVIGEARMATVENNERKPAWLWSSELLDGNTCSPCSRIDGTEWSTIEEARRHYPPMSGYVDCAGGSRCRGTCVFVWGD